MPPVHQIGIVYGQGWPSIAGGRPAGVGHSSSGMVCSRLLGEGHAPIHLWEFSREDFMPRDLVGEAGRGFLSGSAAWYAAPWPLRTMRALYSRVAAVSATSMGGTHGLVHGTALADANFSATFAALGTLPRGAVSTAFGIGYSRWLGETQSPVLLWAYPRQEEPWSLNPSRDGTGELARGAA